MTGLAKILEKIPAGNVEDMDQKRFIEKALSDCWESLAGASDTSMKADKLSGRMEDIVWQPPLLSFHIERHGGTVCGSSRAALHRWTVDVTQNRATCETGRHRQLTPMSKRFNAKPIAEEIVALILAGEIDPRLKWKEDFHFVVVDIANIVPDEGAQQTTTSRRKRFREECNRLLKQSGWDVVKHNTFRKPAS